MELFSYNSIHRNGICNLPPLKTKMEKQKTKILEWLKTRIATTTFALLAFIGGFFFLNKSITGNTIVTETSYLSLLSLIGLVLIFCSLILALYSVKRR